MTVLDAYAIISYFRGDESAEEVADLLRTEPVLTTVNAAEVVDQMIRVWGRSTDDVEGDLALLGHSGLRLHGLDAELALHAGGLRARHYHRRSCAVSLADCVAAATALELRSPLATSDPALAAMLRAEGGHITGLPDSSGRRP